MEKLSARTIVLGSRPSKLARWQTEYILAKLKSTWPGLKSRLVTLITTGDKSIDRPLPEIGGKGVFTIELEAALHSGEIDLAVHSLKDLPVESAPGLVIGAVDRRVSAQDVLISAGGGKFYDLPQGSRVGTSSLRREAQIKAARPDLNMLPLRGNIDTRIRKLLTGEYDAILLAAAGVERLGLDEYISEYLSFDLMLPAPGQGALAIQCRAADEELLTLLEPLHDRATHRAVTAERAFLSTLGSGCSAPVAAYAVSAGENIRITGLVASIDGQKVIRVSAMGSDPHATGELLATKALEQGAGKLLS